MSTRISFGVELEFCLAFIYEDQADIDPLSTKTLRFDNRLPTERITSDRPSSATMIERIFRHIGMTIHGARHNINLDRLAAGDITNWEITRDNSIRPADDDEGYDNVGVEVKSPALIFCPESLSQVEEVCELLTQTYRIRNNISTGLHIHLGHEKLGYSFQNLKKLIAFIYTFEPQLSSLHPVHRIAHMYGNAMRDTCIFTTSYQRLHGRRPTAREFCANVFKCERKADLLHDARDYIDHKNGNYNFMGVDEWTDPLEKRHTVEFRQHEGTMDGVRIGQWIRVLVGIVRFVEDGHPGEYFRLLTSLWEAERWEKEGDGRDEERAREMGPTLADHGFTIVDLLRFIDLPMQAAYFEGKWYKHTIAERPREKQCPAVVWEYEKAWKEGSQEFEQAKQMRELWEIMQKCKEAEGEEGGMLTFDPDDAMWPAHWVEEGSMSGSGSSVRSYRESSEEEFPMRDK